MKTMINKFRFYTESYDGKITVHVCDTMQEVVRLHDRAKSNKDYRFVTSVICYDEVEGH